MDREQEDMQFLGIFGIYREAYRIIFSWRKIFSEITLALILPLSFIFLGHIEVSEVLFSKIIHNENALERSREGSRRYEKISDLLQSEWTAFILFKVAYFTFLLIFSLLSTSAVVYTIACIYTGREVTFNKVMSVVPKVWKRLMVTFLCTFLAFFAYNVVAFFIFFTWLFLVGFNDVGLAGVIVLLVVFFAGSVYLTILWQLASVVTVLEDTYGIRAVIKSKELIKGKMVVAVVIFIMLNLSNLAVQTAFEKLVVRHESFGIMTRMAYAIICLLLLFKLLLFQLVIQTVIYFVCKSYHHENIDKSALSDHLEVYLGDYVPLMAKDVQLEQFHV